MTGKPNKARGEVEVKIGPETYVLRPNMERQVILDDMLPRGIMGTLAIASEDKVLKVMDAARVIHCLADDAPPIDDLARQVMEHGAMAETVTTCLTALGHCAMGTTPQVGSGN